MAKSLTSYPITSFTHDSASSPNRIRFGIAQNKHYLEFDNGNEMWAYSTPIPVSHSYDGVSDVSISIAGYFPNSTSPLDNAVIEVEFEAYKQSPGEENYWISSRHFFDDLKSVIITPSSSLQAGVEAFVTFSYPEADAIQVSDLLTIRFRRNGADPGDVASDSFRVLSVELREEDVYPIT